MKKQGRITKLLSLIIAFSLLFSIMPVLASENNDELSIKLQLNKCGYEKPTNEEKKVEGVLKRTYRYDASNGNYSNEQENYWKSYSSDYYYNKLSDLQKKLWKSIEKSAIEAAVNSTDLEYIKADKGYKGLSTDEIYNVLNMFKLSNSQYFFLSNENAIWPYSDGEYVPGIRIYDAFQNGKNRLSEISKFMTKVNEWISEINLKTYDEEKVKQAVDIICNNTIYGFGTYDQSAYSLVNEGKSVCAGYSATFQILLNKSGIEAIEVAGIGNGGDHAWNLVKIHDIWYENDVTFADQNDKEIPGYFYGITYSYYNKSDKTFSKEHQKNSNYSKVAPECKYDSTLNSGFDYGYKNPYFKNQQNTYFKINSNIECGDYEALCISNAIGTVPDYITYENLKWKIKYLSPIITNISISKKPTKLTYLEGKDALDVTGGEITIFYDNGSSEKKTLTKDMVSGFDNTKLGAQTLTVSYGGMKTSYKIEIKENHIYGKGIITKKATYLSEGVMTYKCIYCGKTITKSIPKLTLSKVSGLKLYSRKTDYIRLSWNKVSVASGYRAYYDIYNKTTKKHYYTSSTYYTNSKLKSAHAYDFIVRPYIIENNKQKVYGSYCSTLKTATLPSGISILKLTSLKGGFTVSYSKKAGYKYQIQYATNSKFKGYKKVNYTKNTKSIIKLSKNKKYYVRVRVYKSINGEYVYSGYSKTKYVTTKK